MARFRVRWDTTRPIRSQAAPDNYGLEAGSFRDSEPNQRQKAVFSGGNCEFRPCTPFTSLRESAISFRPDAESPQDSGILRIRHGQVPPESLMCSLVYRREPALLARRGGAFDGKSRSSTDYRYPEASRRRPGDHPRDGEEAVRTHSQ